MKYRNHRPGFVFIDDIEELNRSGNDNVSTPEKRAELARWFRAFIPSLAQPHKIRMAGTMLHEESLIARNVKSESWESLVVPVEHLDEQGNRVPAWPDKFPLDWIDRARAEAEADGQLEAFAQEYLCQAAAPQSHAFREGHLRLAGNTAPAWCASRDERRLMPNRPGWRGCKSTAPAIFHATYRGHTIVGTSSELAVARREVDREFAQRLFDAKTPEERAAILAEGRAKAAPKDTGEWRRPMVRSKRA